VCGIKVNESSLLNCLLEQHISVEFVMGRGLPCADEAADDLHDRKPFI